MMKISYNQIKNIFIKQIVNLILIVFLFHTFSNQGNYLLGCSYIVYIILFFIFSIEIFEITTKKISYFQLEGEYQNKKRFFCLVKKIVFKIGIFSFIILFLLAKPLASWIVKTLMLDLEVKQLVDIFQISSLFGLFVPLKSLFLGYFSAHKKEKEILIAELIEESIKIIGILGSVFFFFQLKKWSDIETAKMIVFVMAFSSFFSFFYLFYFSKVKKKEFEKETLKVDYTLISDQKLKQDFKSESISYLLFIIFPILYLITDYFFIIEFLPKKFSDSIQEIETIFTTISFWGFGLILGILSMLGIYFFQKNQFSFLEYSFEKGKTKLQNFLEKMISVFIPVMLFLIAVMNQIIIVLYENHHTLIEISTFQILVLFLSILSFFGSILLLAQEKKKIIQFQFLGFLIKMILTIPLFTTMTRLGFLACDGAFIATALGYGISSYLSFHWIGKKYQLNEEKMIRKILNIVLLSLGMVMVLVFIGMKIQPTNRLISILYLLFGGFLLKVFFSIKK